VVHSRDDESVGMANKIISPENQHQISQITMGQHCLGKTKPDELVATHGGIVVGLATHNPMIDGLSPSLGCCFFFVSLEPFSFCNDRLNISLPLV